MGLNSVLGQRFRHRRGYYSALQCSSIGVELRDNGQRCCDLALWQLRRDFHAAQWLGAVGADGWGDCFVAGLVPIVAKTEPKKLL